MEANGLAVYPYMSASGAETGGRGEWFLGNKWEMAAHLQRSEKDSEQFLRLPGAGGGDVLLSTLKGLSANPGHSP